MTAKHKSIFMLIMLSLSFMANAQSTTQSQKEQLQKLRNFEVQLESLYSVLNSKAQKVLPPLQALNVSAMSFDDLVEVQIILAQFYALDSKLAAIPTKLRKPLSQQNFPELEKEIKALESLIRQL